MNGAHDLGGMHGFGPVVVNNNEPPFKHEWERKVFGIFVMTFAGGNFNLDEFRRSIESMDPVHYLGSSYYEHWFASVEAMLHDKGIVPKDELDARCAALKGKH